MDFKQITQSRYAVKQFDGKKLPENKVTELLDIIRMAPSSFNIQPWKIIVIESADLKKKLAPAAWNQPQIESSSHLLVFCANSDIVGNIKKIEAQALAAGAKKEDIKGYIDMMLGMESRLSPEGKLDWAKRQTYIALGNAVNGAKSLGFDSAPMEGFSPDDFAKILNTPKNIVPVVLCGIGYAADKPRPKMRFPISEVFERR